MRLINWLTFIFLTVALVVLPSSTTQAARILGLFPHHGETHHMFFAPILKALDDAGHEVHVVSHFEMKNRSSSFRNIIVSNPGSTKNAIDLSWFSSRPSFIHFMEFFMLRDWAASNCEITFKTPAVQEILEKRIHYDVILMEQFVSDCMFGIAHRVNAPVIALSSCAMMPWHYNRMGNPQTPSLIPALFMGYSDQMKFHERLANWLAFYGMQALYYTFSDSDSNRIIRKYIGEDVPDVRELAKRTSLYFVNQHYSLSGAKPLTPGVIELGGIHIEEQKALDKELDDFINSAEHGVIYISWGSMIKATTLPEEKRNAIISAVGRFKQKVVWKWEDDNIPNKPANLYIRKWMPQRDILCHPKVKVFWSHGGLMGSSEAAYCGTPVVATPMYGDQFLNSAAFQARGAGIVLNYEDITTENVVKALKFALDPETARQSSRVSYSYKNRPMTPIETALYWVDHTIATGGVPLAKPPTPFMSFSVYYGLDVIAVIIFILVAVGYSWLWLIKRVLCRRTSSKGEGGKVKKQ